MNISLIFLTACFNSTIHFISTGWWFPPDCGSANPNGPYPIDPNKEMDYALDGAVDSNNSMLKWMSWKSSKDLLKSVSIQIVPGRRMVEEDLVKQAEAISKAGK